MRLTFRSKVLANALLAATALIVLAVVGATTAARVEARLTSIREVHMPRLELEPQLAAGFDQLRRALQDSVAAHDEGQLEATAAIERSLLERLSNAGAVVDPRAAEALRASIDDYFSFASDVSRRLIAGETGELLVDDIRAMQRKQTATSDLIAQAAAVDRGALSLAFDDAARAARAGREFQRWISVGCIVLVLVLSLVIGRSLLRSLSEITDGFERFGRGDFASRIPVTAADEVGDLARDANRMAEGLERIDRERSTAESALKRANNELEAFSYSVAHDLRAPLRAISGFSTVLIDGYGEKLDDEGKDYLTRIGAAADRMSLLIDALLSLSRLTRTEFRGTTTDLAQTARSLVKLLRAAEPGREVDFFCPDELPTFGDSVLLRALLENLLGNAWKFTSKTAGARIEVGVTDARGSTAFFVRDNGAGFDMAFCEKLFVPFQRLHDQESFAGTGVGLATVQRIVHRHHGEVWAESAPDKGATFYFTIRTSPEGDTA